MIETDGGPLDEQDAETKFTTSLRDELNRLGDRLPGAHGVDGETLTSAEAATVLGVSEDRLKQLKAQTKITPVSAKYQVIRYLRSDVEALRQQRAQAGLPEIHRPREVRPCGRADCPRTFKYRPD